MKGLAMVTLVAIAIAIIIVIKEKKAASRQRTVRISRENSRQNEDSGTSRAIQPASSLPPIRCSKQAARRVANQNTQPRRLPAYQRAVESIYDFPHCPKCWSKNRRGEPQVVFWQPAARCYKCARDHRFRRNGTLIV